MSSKYAIPKWAIERGGEKAWRKWLSSKVASCQKKANKYCAKEHKISTLTAVDWKDAIHKALCRSKGLSYFSKFPITLIKSKFKEKHPMWPSVDHLDVPTKPKVAIETRLVNDMKSILSEKEFNLLLSHLTVVMKIKAIRLQDTWRPKGCF